MRIGKKWQFPKRGSSQVHSVTDWPTAIRCQFSKVAISKKWQFSKVAIAKKWQFQKVATHKLTFLSDIWSKIEAWDVH